MTDDPIRSFLAGILGKDTVAELDAPAPAPAVINNPAPEAPQPVGLEEADDFTMLPSEDSPAIIGETEDAVYTPIDATPEQIANELNGMIEAAQATLDQEAAEAEELRQRRKEPDSRTLERASVKLDVSQIAMSADEIDRVTDLRNFATLVDLSTKLWHAKARDVKAAKAAAAATGAKAEAYDLTKKLLAGADSQLKQIHKIVNATRLRHYQLTLPWSTVSVTDTTGKRSGSRLLPNTRFTEYVKVMAKAKAELDAALDAFEPAYPAMVQVAKQNLGSSFNAEDYPDVSEIRGRFGISFEFLPIPSGQDFGGLASAQTQRLAEALEERKRIMVANAMQDLWKRVLEAVGHIAERFGDPDAIFHDTTFTNLGTVADDIDHLNVTDDPRLAEVGKRIRRNLLPATVDGIRKDKALRSRLAAEAASIIEEVKANG